MQKLDITKMTMCKTEGHAPESKTDPRRGEGQRSHAKTREGRGKWVMSPKPRKLLFASAPKWLSKSCAMALDGPHSVGGVYAGFYAEKPSFDMDG